ncbi:aspartate kinase [Choiromyces venosus 120613-1]|uniref:Aspartokinase n=1 Tax=Choiromyces venosus 120613-1 TaxID=1336337 RepID=A0A3N4K5G9_9PEZI|nr:aspartate kinase [Choiromyces venosus 120613-1]
MTIERPPSPPLSPFTPVHLQTNNPKLPWVVQKFGGTSVGKLPLGVVEVVKKYLPTNRVAIVCSARSMESKELGTTNRLLRAAEEVINPDSTEWVNIIDGVHEAHVAAARDIIRSREIFDKLKGEVEKECASLKEFLEAAQIISEISPRSKDFIVGTGEKLSCLFMTAVLRDRGIDAEYISLENILPPSQLSTYAGSKTLTPPFYKTLTTLLEFRMRSLPAHKVPVITGFFSPVPGSLLTTIGRGYTDLCAALLSVSVRAQELQIWKEVDGIFTADPRKVPTARLLSFVTPEEAAELTYYGSEVLHPLTMEQVVTVGIPVRILNVWKPSGSGTIICSKKPLRTRPLTLTPPVSDGEDDDDDDEADEYILEGGEQKLRKLPTAVTMKKNIHLLTIHSNRKSISHGFLASVFQILDQHELTIDLIATSEVHVSLALVNTAPHTAAAAIEALKAYGDVQARGGLCIVSLVGRNMKRMVGVAGRMFAALGDAGVNVEMISQGASEIGISCVVREDAAVGAVNVLHARLFS